VTGRAAVAPATPPRLRRALSLALAALAVALLAPSAASAAASTFPYCSWWLKTTPETANVAFPDAAATYWTTPFLAAPGTKLEVSGTYPDARYMSVNVYDASFGTFSLNGVASGLADYLIAPSEGSVNPFQVAGPPGGAFTLTVSGDAQPGQVNTLPLAPADEPSGRLSAPLGYLVYRVYLPTGGNSTVALPQVTLVNGDERVPLPPCSPPATDLVEQTKPDTAAANAETLARTLGVADDGDLRGALGTLIDGVRDAAGPLPSGVRAPSGGTKPCRGSACPATLQFFRAKSTTTNAFFPNVDNAYVSALFRVAPGQVVVVRGRAPISPSGSSPVPWPQAGMQLRYWSLCNNLYRKPWPVVANQLPGGGVDYGCVADDDTAIDAAGNYTYVVAPEGARAAVEAAGGTFVPLSSKQPRARQVLIFRNMLPATSFPYAVQDAPQDGHPSSTASAMGVYYPRAYRCTLAQFTAGSARCG
jgi:hypothetical protein